MGRMPFGVFLSSVGFPFLPKNSVTSLLTSENLLSIPTAKLKNLDPLSTVLPTKVTDYFLIYTGVVQLNLYQLVH